MTTIFNTAIAYARRISRGKTPKHPSELHIPLDFTATPAIQVSINVLQGLPNVSGIDGVQSVFIDNSANGDTVVLKQVNGPSITCPAFAQAIFPFFFNGEVLNFIGSSGGGVLVDCWFLNTREQAQLWSAKIPIAGVINVSGSTIFTQPFSGSFVDSSSVLAAANVSQLLMAANANRQLAAIRNPGTPASQNIAAPEPVYLNWGAPAAVNGTTSWELFPGESLPQFLLNTDQDINWTAATPGHQLIAKYM